jgi:hypothetical protein
MSGKASRNKGARGERKTANELNETSPDHIQVKRGIGQVRAGDEVPDVDGIDCMWIEVKTTKRGNPRAALKQATEAAPPGRIPIAVIRDDRKEPFMVMAWPQFIELWEEYWQIKTS